MEAHGTGTPLGDPIEINALKKAYKEYYDFCNVEMKESNYCGIGSVKTNIGHLESASGMASIIKVLLCMQHGMLPQLLNFKELNQYIELDNSPFFIVKEPMKWENRQINEKIQPKQAAVSGFGMGGVNAHVILEEPPKVQRKQLVDNSVKHLVLLSSKKDRLKTMVQDLLDFLCNENGLKVSIEDIAFTMMFGRDEFEERLAVYTDSTANLIALLQGYMKGETSKDCFYGLASGIKGNIPEKVMFTDDLLHYAVKWVNGGLIDWDISTFPGKRTLLTGHPFLKKRCWFMNMDNKESEIKTGIVEKKISEKGFITKITVTTDSLMVAHHLVQSKKTMPGMGYVELALKTLAEELGANNVNCWSMKKIYWIKPAVFLEDSMELTLSFKPAGNEYNFQINISNEVYCQGVVEIFSNNLETDRLDIQKVIGRCSEEESNESLYSRFIKSGLLYGPSFQMLQNIYCGQNEAVAKINDKTQKTVVGILDGALQTAVRLSIKDKSGEDSQYVPYFLENLVCKGDLEKLSFYYVRQQEDSNESVLKFDIFGCDQKGQVLLSFENFVKRALPGKGDNSQQVYYYTSQWRKKESNWNPLAATGVMIINGDKSMKENAIATVGEGIQITMYKTFKTDKLEGESLRADDSVDFLKLFKELMTKKSIPSHIVMHSYSPGKGDLKVLLHLIQSLIKAKIKNPVKISYFDMDGKPEFLPYIHAVGGLARTLKYEYPRIRLEVTSFDGKNDKNHELLWKEVFANFSPMNETRFVLGKRYQREMVPVAGKHSNEELCFKKGGVYVFAGGAGGLGKIFSEFLARNYQANLILLGRKAKNEHIQIFLDDISKTGGNAEYIQTDIADEHQLKESLKGIRAQYGGIDGVIQAGGMIEDSFIINKSAESFERVISSKIDGTVNLDKFTAYDNLDFFIMFSSVAALMPNQGQCDYSSGNSFMDYYSEYRSQMVAENKRKGLSISINWPLWESGGIQVMPQEKEHLKNVFGMQPVENNNGLKIFAELLKISKEQNLTQILGIEGDKAKIDKHFQISNHSFAKLESILPELLTKDLKIMVSMVFQKPMEEISENISLKEFGVDSVSLLKIAQISRKFIGIDIKPTLFFEYETIMQLREYLLQEKYDKIKENYEKLGKTVELYRSTGFLDVELSEINQGIYQRVYHNNEFYMVDHVVEEKFNVPGACFIEMARQAGVLAYPDQKLCKLTNNYWAKQLSSSGEPFTVYIQLQEKDDRVCYEIYSLEKTQQRDIYATGELVFESFEQPQKVIEGLDFKEIKDRCSVSWSREHVYKQIHAEGLIVGPTFMPMQEIYSNENETLAILELPEIISDTYQDYLIHPTMLTGVFQTALMNNRFYEGDYNTYIPIAIDCIEIMDLIPQRCYVYCKSNPKNKNNQDIKKFDLMVCNENGGVVAILNGFAIRARKTDGQKAADRTLAAIEKKAVVDKSINTVLAQNFIRTMIAPVIGVEPADIKPDDDFETYGINSVLILELNQVLEENFGSGLSKTLFFEYRNLSELTEYFMDEHKEVLRAKLPVQPELEESAEEEISKISEKINFEESAKVSSIKIQSSGQTLYEPISRDIAIIGLAGRYPKAKTLLEFWEVLKNATDCIEEIRTDRFDFRPYYDADKENGKLVSKWGSFIDDVDKFDPMFFNISPREAELMDPQERLFLEVVWHTLEDAGYTRQGLKDKTVGVFVGALWQPYQEVGVHMRKNGNMVGPSTLLYNIANRVSYYCNFNGPSMAVDTACSSSLTALHMACKSIQSGESDLAIAGGVNLSIGESKYMFLNQYKFLSSEGKCRSFGAGGDGYVPGEGVGAILLKPLEKAEKDRDHIYGVIKATAVNHGGKTNGYSVPNPIAQSEVVLKTLEEANINPRNISYIETHGTGTALGDPIEITGLTRAFNKYTQDKQFCHIGSVKSNIGHLEAAAGIAGLTKILLQMKYKKLVPSLHSRTLNPYIDFKSTPFKVQQELEDWNNPMGVVDGKVVEYPRIAGLSSFGAGGANAHVIVSEYLPENESSRISANFMPVLVVLSAKNKEQLKERAILLKNVIEDGCLSDEDLVNMAYTLQVGREAMEEKLAIIVNSLKELDKKLEDFINGQDHIENLVRGKNDPIAIKLFSEDADMQAVVKMWAAKGYYSKIAELWVRGMEIDWGIIYGDIKPYRISLPVYPFANEHYWLSDNDEISESSIRSLVKSTALHPLLHNNVSNFFEQRFCTQFSGREFFLEDHVVKGEKVLPGVIFLEMARAAVNIAMGNMTNEVSGIRMRNIVWIRPVVVKEEPIEINVRLSLEESGQVNYEIYRKDKEDTSFDLVYCQGDAVILQKPKTEIINIDDLKAECDYASFSTDECYEVFRSMNAEYGSRLQGIQKVFVGQQKLLAKLSLPMSMWDAEDEFVLHPTIMDSVLQLCLIIGSTEIGSFGDKEKRNPYLPFALENLEILKELQPQMWAYVRPSGEEGVTKEFQKLDIDVCNDSGEVCIRIKGFSTRVLEGEFQNDETSKIYDATETVLLTPEWHKANVLKSEFDTKKESNVLIVGGNDRKFEEIKEKFCNSKKFHIEMQNTIEELTALLDSYGQIDHIVWFAPDEEVISATDNTLIEQQEYGVITVFRLIKALLNKGYGTKKLVWSVITYKTCQVLKSDVANPGHASLHGLLGTMAQEYPNWDIRLFDLEDSNEFSVNNIFTISSETNGKPLALRNSVWYEEKLIPVQSLSQENVAYRSGGVYVVIGGAGGSVKFGVNM
nr:SDR family NAD(P)-dependent oxidoreductase [Ruminiclostridium josui]